MASCVVVTAYICLLLGFLSVGVSFFAPFWVLSVNENAYEGLWGRCRDLRIDTTESLGEIFQFKCVWFHEDNFGWERNKQQTRDWFLPCQVLEAFGLVTVFAILFVASIHLCCSCCKESISLLKAIGAVLILGAIMLLAAIGTFAGFSYRDEKTSVNSQVSRFDWGFYVNLPGVVLVLLSALLYLIESCRYDGYESGHNEIV